MIGAAHIYRRLRRWLVMSLAQSRLQKLTDLVTDLERQIAEETAMLAALRMQHQQQATWLQYHSAPGALLIHGPRVAASNISNSQP